MPHDAAIARIIELAARDQCVARPTLIDADISDKVIASLIRRRFLVRVFRGVYLVGTHDLTHRSFLRASTLYAGPGAAPTHRTGLELRGVLPTRTGHATISTPRRNVVDAIRTKIPLADGRTGVAQIESTSRPLITELVDGFETTLMPRTLVDAVGHLEDHRLRRAWKRADFLCLLDADAIRDELDSTRLPGTPRLRRLLDRHAPVTRPGMDVRSVGGEMTFLELLREAGLPEPEVNVPMMIGRVLYVADFYWRDLGLILETDGGQHDPAEDKVRDMDFFVAGLDVLRIDNDRMRDHRAWCIDRVRAAIERQRRRVG